MSHARTQQGSPPSTLNKFPRACLKLLLFQVLPCSSMSEQVALGYTAAVVAVFFFGTCYVPAKTYATYGASNAVS